MRRFFIAIFKYLGVVGCLGLLSCLLIRTYFHISVAGLEEDPEVETLILGDSHPLHSISADLLGKARNDAKSSEDYFNTYIDLCLRIPYLPNLKTVILGVGYHSFTIDNDSYPDEFPAYMSIYPHLKEKEELRLLTEEVVSAETRKEVMYSYELGIPFKNCVAELKRNAIDLIFTGTNGGTLDAIVARHYYDDENEIIPPSSLQEDMLARIVDACKEHGLSLVLFNAPITAGYLERVPQAFADEKTVFYLNDTNIQFPDSCYRDADHLNQAGRDRFTLILRDTLKQMGLIAE